MHDVFVARQPIFDRDLKVFAYELLFRRADVGFAEVIDGDRATSEVILNAFTVIGLDELVGTLPAFINMTRTFLLQEQKVVLPPERVVLEVLEDCEPDEALVLALQEWSRQGYRISLDDFVFHESRLPLVELADIVKVEIAALTPAQITEHVRRLRPYKVRLLAEKVETQAQFEHCHRLGFDFFQGYFLERPNVLRGASIPTSRIPTLSLLAALHRPDVRVDELEDIISRDVSLSYKLLRYLNSPLFPIKRPIESIRQALIYLGWQELRAWASLLVLSAVPGKPQELMITLMVRAKMCELLAERLRLRDPKAYFIIGLFSGLDALMDAPLPQILERVSLGEEMAAALLRREGDGGRIIDCVLSYEHADWERILKIQIPADVVIESYLTALQWAKQAQAEQR